MTAPEPDPRTDGIGDGGQNELPPPSPEEIAAGAEADRAHRDRAIRDLSEDDEEELTRVKMRPVTEAEEARDNW
jgi:hypothetical protein